MSSAAQDIMAGCPSSSVPTKEANPETTLGSAYSPVDYMSITSFPRLPEDDMMSVDNAAKLRSKDDDNVLSEQDTGELLDLTGVTGTFLLSWQHLNNRRGLGGRGGRRSRR